MIDDYLKRVQEAMTQNPHIMVIDDIPRAAGTITDVFRRPTAGFRQPKTSKHRRQRRRN